MATRHPALNLVCNCCVVLFAGCGVDHGPATAWPDVRTAHLQISDTLLGMASGRASSQQ
jgi:hypothetical protein